MSVREYIGARYIPLFADPIEWDSTAAYEPLTVVKNQGNSYVSRQYVPEGVAITNTAYWILWADFNAQLEQYRQEVQRFDGRISANEDSIETLETLLPASSFSSSSTVSDAIAAVSELLPASDFSSSSTVADAIAGLIAQDARIEGKIDGVLDVKDLGQLNEFRFAFIPPNGYNVNNMMSIAQRDKETFALHSWTYGGYDTDTEQYATIPLFTDAGGVYVVTNAIGEKISCSPFVCDVLYKNGYTDLAGESRYITSSDAEHSLEDYLVAKGWTKTEDIGDLVPGAIIAQGVGTTMEAAAHTFIYVSPTQRYDAGSTAFIRSGGLDPLSWYNYMNLGSNTRTALDSLFENGFYRFMAPYRINQLPEGVTSYSWSGFSIRTGTTIFQFFSCSQGSLMRFSSTGGYGYTEVYSANGSDNANMFFSPADRALDSSKTQSAPLTLSLNATDLNNDVERNSAGHPVLKYPGLYEIVVNLTMRGTASGNVLCELKHNNGAAAVQHVATPYSGDEITLSFVSLFKNEIYNNELLINLFTRSFTGSVTIDASSYNAGVKIVRLR